VLFARLPHLFRQSAALSGTVYASKPMGISQYRLAKEIGVSQRRIGQIVAGQRAITADTDLRLCKFLG